MVAVMATQRIEAKVKPPEGLKIGTSSDWAWITLQSEVAPVFGAVLQRFQGLPGFGFRLPNMRPAVWAPHVLESGKISFRISGCLFCA